MTQVRIDRLASSAIRFAYREATLILFRSQKWEGEADIPVEAENKIANAILEATGNGDLVGVAEEFFRSRGNTRDQLWHGHYYRDTARRLCGKTHYKDLVTGEVTKKAGIA